MKKTTSELKRGITWSIFSTLENLDFADDIAVLSSRQYHMQEKAQRLSHYASKLGSVMSTEDPTQKDIKNRLAKARTAFHRSRPIRIGNSNRIAETQK